MLAAQLDHVFGVTAHRFRCTLEHLADDAHRPWKGGVRQRLDGTAAMHTASGGSMKPSPTAAARPPKNPTDLGTSISTLPT
jgi:hypothetical protein